MSVAPSLVGGRYRLIEVIAHGGMGVVWRAHDERLDRPVALKQLRIHPGITEREAEIAKNRAIREAHITAQLEHPHAVPVLDAVEHEGQPCLVMPFLPCTPLSAVLRKRTTLPLPDVIRIGGQAASALAAAHRLRIVHRDVKPGNVLITRDGTAHISDFGISHAMGDATLTDTGFLHGTPAYLSPEVARGGSATFASDVFCLGSTLYAALEGAPPFGSDANPIALLHRVAAARVEPPGNAGELQPLLLQMLSEDKAARPTMDVVAASLAGLKAETAPGEPARPVRTPPSITPTSSSAALTSWFPPAGGGSTERIDGADTTAAAPVSVGAAPSGSARDEPSPASPTPGASSAPAGPADGAQARRRGLVALGSAAALVAAALIWAIWPSQVDPDAPQTAGDRVAVPTSTPSESAVSPSVSPTESAAAPTSPSATPDDQTIAAPSPVEPSAAEPSPEPSTEAESQAESSPSSDQAESSPSSDQAESSPSSEQTEPTSQDRDTELASAITDYYALMPRDTDAAWTRMTADYQSNHAGGRAAYEDFWADVDAISVSEVQADPPNQASATLTYSYSDGRTVVERTAYRFVEDSGALRIAESDVLSSTGG